jgi:outer membrane protein OmpA-like peptidoglycan-associated protein
MVRRTGLVVFTAALLSILLPAAAEAQLGRITDRAKRAAEDQISREVEELVRDAVRCAFDDLDCIEKAESDGKDVVLTNKDGEILTDEDGNPVTDRSQLPSSGATTFDAASSTFDFEAGDRSLFTEDFASDNLGDFPRNLEYMRGTMEVAQNDEGKRFLLATGGNSQFAIVLPSTLPDQFTIELDIHDPATEQGTWISTQEMSQNGRVDANVFNFGNWRGSGIWDPKPDPLAVIQDETMTKEIVTARIMADGDHVKAYLNEVRVANVPRVEFTRGDRIYFSMDGRQDRPIYVGNIRIAAGGRDLYDALSTDGRVEVHDILFDTDSDVIRPESASILQEIGTMLQEHSELSLLIEGHTDNEGDFDHNMTLSGDRATSVKAYLVQNFGIEDARLRTMGLGPSRPVDTNDTEAGRQRNRRVELVRM